MSSLYAYWPQILLGGGILQIAALNLAALNLAALNLATLNLAALNLATLNLAKTKEAQINIWASFVLRSLKVLKILSPPKYIIKT